MSCRGDALPHHLADRRRIDHRDRRHELRGLLRQRERDQRAEAVAEDDGATKTEGSGELADLAREGLDRVLRGHLARAATG